MCFGGSDASQQIAAQEAQRQQMITQGMGSIDRAFSGFDPKFYQGLQNQYLASTIPQVQRQFQQTRNQLGYNLGNQGLLRSSAAQNLGGSLQQQLAQNLFNVGNQATQAVQGLQRQVGQEKSNVVAQLQQSANPTLAAQQATESASQFSAPSIVQPLGNLFQNWSNTYLANKLGQLYSPYSQPYTQQSMGFSQGPVSYNVGR